MNPLTPPHDEAAEMAVLGSVLVDGDVLAHVAGSLKSGDFYLPRHGLLWGVLVDLSARGLPVDALLAFREVERRGLIEETGGRDYIATLSSAVTSPVHAEHYAGIVREKAGLRALSHLAQSLASAVSGGDGYDEALKLAHDGLAAAGERTSRRDARPIGPAMLDVLGALQGQREAGVVCPTDLHNLDDLLAGGLHKGELVVVGARPGVGKSCLGNNVAVAASLRGASVLIYSLEMTIDSIARNMLAARAQVSGDRMRKGAGHIRREDLERLAAAASEIGNTSLLVNDNSSANVPSIRREAQRVKARQGLDLLIVDYLQLMESARPAERRNEDVAAMSRGLKILAKDLDVPVVALSQLNRQSEERDGGRPRLADLRESGSIEQDADVVLLLHRPWVRTKSEMDRGIAEIIVAKNRHGPTDVVKVAFVDEHLLFRNLSRSDVQQ